MSQKPRGDINIVVKHHEILQSPRQFVVINAKEPSAKRVAPAMPVSERMARHLLDGAPMASSKLSCQLHVAVVCDNAATLEDLQAYFERSGVQANGVRALGVAEAIAPEVDAVVLFPDDFDNPGVVALISELRSTRPRLLLLVITRQPQRFEAVVAPDGRSVPPLILPRPCFVWVILDAIRSHDRPPTH